jgi:hypothetical protein
VCSRGGGGGGVVVVGGGVGGGGGGGVVGGGGGGGGGGVVITFMQGIYNIPETNHVPTVYSVAAVLYVRFLPHIILFHV